MMNLRIDDRHAYVEVEVFGQYDSTRMPEIMAAMKRLTDMHGYFSELEIHHGQPGNMLQAINSAVESLGLEDEEASRFLTKMHRYALVTDNPGILMRLIIMFARLSNGTTEMRLFKSHERDIARQWIEEPRLQNGVH